mmetsp:Transcript_24664/g.79667  ORF Transcript_24664/g.79667 Transcript_24664/m.79667 type:complete len:269 (-) Transcript_24664:17-823(-)
MARPFDRAVDVRAPRRRLRRLGREALRGRRPAPGHPGLLDAAGLGAPLRALLRHVLGAPLLAREHVPLAPRAQPPPLREDAPGPGDLHGPLVRQLLQRRHLRGRGAARRAVAVRTVGRVAALPDLRVAGEAQRPVGGAEPRAQRPAGAALRPDAPPPRLAPRGPQGQQLHVRVARRPLGRALRDAPPGPGGGPRGAGRDAARRVPDRDRQAAAADQVGPPARDAPAAPRLLRRRRGPLAHPRGLRRRLGADARARRVNSGFGVWGGKI